MASYTVNFTDGSNHTYDNVPEGVTEDQIRSRAGDEYGDKEVSHIAGSQPAPTTNTMPEGMGSVNPDTTMGQRAIAGGQTAFNMTNDVLSSPIGHAVEAVAGGKYAMNKLGDLAKQYGAARANMPPAPATSPIVTPPNVGGGARPQMFTGNPQQTFDTLRAPISTAPTPTPVIGGPAAQEGSSFIQNITQKFAPMAAKVAPVLQGASRALAPAMVAKELYYTSPEEKAALAEMGRNHTTLKDWTKHKLGI